MDNAASIRGVEPCCDNSCLGLGASLLCVLVFSLGNLTTAKELVLLPMLIEVFSAVLVDISIADIESQHLALPAA